MLTIKKRGLKTLAVVAAAALSLTACGPPGTRALHKGDRLIQQTNFDGAIAALTQAVNLLTNDPPEVRATAYNLLGLAYHGAGNAPKALENYQKAHSLDRNFVAADYNIGCLELENSNLISAQDFLTTYNSLQKWNVDGFLKLGAVHLRLALQAPIASERNRQLDLAKKTFESAQNMARTPQAGNNLGVIELLSSPRPTPAVVSNALLKFNVALAAAPDYAPALLNVAIVYDKYLNDGHKALAAYGQYLARDPPPPYAKEVAVLTNNLDRAMRFQIQMQNHTAAPPTVAPITSSNNVAMVAPKPPQPPAQTIPLTTSPSRVESVPSTAIASSNPAQPAIATTITPAQNREAATPVVTPPVVQRTELPATTTTVAPEESAPTTTLPPPKKSVLSKINPLNWFGGKTSASSSGDNGDSGGRYPRVTPLPDEEPGTTRHYTPPDVAIYPGNREEADRLRNEGATAEKESRIKDAIADYQQALKADPNYYDVALTLGLASIKAEDYNVSLEALHHALILKPDSADARYAYAWSLAKKNYDQDAANELEKLIGQHPDEIRAHLLLGNLYASQLGQPDLARGHYQQVLQSDPNNPQASAIQVWLKNNPAH